MAAHLAHRSPLPSVGRWAAAGLVRLGALSILVGLAFVAVGPWAGWYREATVLSSSMAPRIPMGSVVIDTPMSPRHVRVGDAITYQVPVGDHHVITHRVVAVLRGGNSPIVRTKGDANATADPWQARLLGGPAWRVRVVVPYLGFALASLRTPWSRALALVVAPLLLAVSGLRRIWARPRPRLPAPAT